MEANRIELYRQALLFMAETRLAIERLETSGIIPSIIEASDAVCACKGKLITTGLGKAGYIAEKSSSSFSSLGIPSCYLHPAQASHGDIGVVQEGDAMLVFSTSGKTREVIETINLARKLNVWKVISVTSHPESPVRSLSDIVIDIGIIREAGYLSLAPTTSSTIMLVVADMLATLCAWRSGITMESFGLRHHSGYLGSLARGETL